jgi:hypothetical protein
VIYLCLAEDGGVQNKVIESMKAEIFVLTEWRSGVQ